MKGLPQRSPLFILRYSAIDRSIFGKDDHLKEIKCVNNVSKGENGVTTGTTNISSLQG